MCVCVCVCVCYASIKKNENLPWMDLGGIILNEISQTMKYECHMVSLLCGNFRNRTNEQTKTKTKTYS